MTWYKVCERRMTTDGDIGSLSASLESTYLERREVDGEDINNPPPTPESKHDLSDTWCDISSRLNFKFTDLVDKLLDLIGDIYSSQEFAKTVQVPFCFEYCRLKYEIILGNMLAEVSNINLEMQEFPAELHMYRNIVVDKGCPKLSESGVTYLESLLCYFGDRIDYVDGELQERKKRGLQCFTDSQAVDMACSFWGPREF